MPLKSKIKQLIESKKEGDYWDFKLKHHSNSIGLVQDILCLANNVHIQGDRFLIFGIDPDDYSIKGIEKEANQQANILDKLSKVPFAGGLYPNIQLQGLEMDGGYIEVLIITDTSDKPYYLEQVFERKEGKLNAGTIYSRIRDRNTAKNGVASFSDIEKMWRQRFGLDQSPQDRFYSYLKDYKNWESVDGSSWYHKIFPEFCIEISDDASEIGDSQDCWVRAAINPKAFYSEIILKYHQTVLWKGLSATIDGARARVMLPDTIIANEGRSADMNVFYAYYMDGLDYRLHEFLLNCRNFTDRNSVEGCMEPILHFDSEEEKEAFTDYLAVNLIKVDNQPYDGFYDHKEPEIAKKDLIYSIKTKELYKAWKKS